MKPLSHLPILDSLDLQPTTIIIIIVGALFVLGIIIFLIIFFSKRKKGPIVTNSEWFTALGNKDNITAIKGVGSRLTVNLKNKDLVNKEKLKALGVSSIVIMSDKMILVIENKAEKIAEILLKDL